MGYKITILPGDGIGPEIMDAAVSVLNHVAGLYDVDFDFTEKLVGGCSIDKHGAPITDDTLQSCAESDAVLLGAIGAPQYDDLPHDQKPEKALLKLREALGLFSNLRPAKIYPALVDASSLKAEVISDTDIMIVRELTGGIYFGTPRGYDEERGWNTLVYTRPEVERIARVAFELALKRRSHVTSVHKSNVLDSSQFWKEIVHTIHADYPGVTLEDMYVDNAAMQLVRNPRRFDVILTQNMFGDIISDIAAMITGSLGMLPSASMGEKHALYEPVHGSAPDITGQNKANPIAMVGSVAMMLAYSFDMTEAAKLLDQAIDNILAAGYRTEDIATPESKVLSTTEMKDKIIDAFSRVYEEKTGVELTTS